MGLHLHIGSVVPEMDEKKGNIRAEMMRGVLRDDKVHIPDVMCLGRRHLLAQAQRSSSKRGAHLSRRMCNIHTRATDFGAMLR